MQKAIFIKKMNRLYENDIAELKDGVNQLWRPLIFLQREILKIRH